MTTELPAIMSPGEGTGSYGLRKDIFFRNNTNTEIFVQCIYINDSWDLFSIDFEETIPGGAEKYTFTLARQISPGSLGVYKALWGSYDGGLSGISGYSPMIWSSTNDRWMRNANAWPCFGLHSNGFHYIHPQSNPKDSSGKGDNTFGMLRYVAGTNGTAKVTAKIRDADGSGGFDGVKGFVTHIPVGNLASNKRPNPSSYSGKYIKPHAGNGLFDTAGTYTWTCPAGVTVIKLLVVGGGGGGNAGYHNGGVGSGGGGGAECNGWGEVSVTPGKTYNITVGAGGKGGTGGGPNNWNRPGAKGGTSSFSGHGLNESASGGNGASKSTAGSGAGSGNYAGHSGQNGYRDGGISRNGCGGDVVIDAYLADEIGMDPKYKPGTGASRSNGSIVGILGGYGGNRGYGSTNDSSWNWSGKNHSGNQHGRYGGGGSGGTSNAGNGGDGVVGILIGRGSWSYNENYGGYVADAFDGKITANLLSNWHPEHKIIAGNGSPTGSTGNTHQSGVSNFRDSVKNFPWGSDAISSSEGANGVTEMYKGMFPGNYNRQQTAMHSVRGPRYLLNGGQADAQGKLKARYIRWYPFKWHSHPSCRVGAYSNDDGWLTGTMTSNAWWVQDGDHGPVHGKLNGTSGVGAWCGPSNRTPGNHWLQMDFGSVKSIDFLASQGRYHTHEQYVTWFLVFASDDAVNWKIVTPHCGDISRNFTTFEKEINIKQGDFIDLVVDCGDHTSAYDTTEVELDVEVVKPGQGPNGNLYVDSDGCIRDATDNKLSGIELDNGEALRIEVESKNNPKNYTMPTRHEREVRTATLNVDYRCDKLTTAGADWVEKVDTTKVDVTALAAANWYTAKHKLTGAEWTFYVPNGFSTDQSARWMYVIGWGWVWVQPNDNWLTESQWVYSTPTQTENAAGTAKGWMLFSMEMLPTTWSHKLFEQLRDNGTPYTDAQEAAYMMVMKDSVTGGATNHPVHVSWSGNGNPYTSVTYTYKIYSAFDKADWGNPVRTATHTRTTSTARFADTPEFWSELGPDHAKVNLTPGHNGSNSEWYGHISPDQDRPETLAAGAQFRTPGNQQMPLIWNSIPQIKNLPREVSVMIRGGVTNNDGKWVVLYKKSRWDERSLERPKYISEDGSVEMKYKDFWVGSSLKQNWWLTYNKGTGSEGVFTYKVPSSAYTSAADRRFPADGSYYYSHLDSQSGRFGEWKAYYSTTKNVRSEFIVYLAWGKTLLDEIDQNDRYTGNVGIEYAELRPDIRTASQKFAGVQYRIPPLGDLTGSRDSNSRIYALECNRGNGSYRRVVLTRSRAGVIDLDTEIQSTGWIGAKVIYPGYNNKPYSDTTWNAAIQNPVPVPHIDTIANDNTNNGYNGFIVAGARMPGELDRYRTYQDCGYDTKFTLEVKKSNNILVESLSNLGPFYKTNSTAATSTAGFMGVDMTGGNVTTPGNISGEGNMLAGDYILRMYNYGEEITFGPHLHSKNVPFSVPGNKANHPPLQTYVNQLYGPNGFNPNRLEYGGNKNTGTYRTQKFCCGRTSNNTNDGSDCVDFKQRVIDSNTLYKSARGGKTAEGIIVRGWNGIGNGAHKMRTGSWYGSHHGGITGPDTGGPTWLEMKNSHPFSSVVVKITTGIDVESDDGCGVTMAASSNLRGKIFDPTTVGAAGQGYMTNAGHTPYPGNTTWWNYYFPGGVQYLGNVTNNNAPWIDGVWNFAGNRGGSSGVISMNGNPSGASYHEKSWGYWKVNKGEDFKWTLYGALNCYGHYGYGQWEGVMVRWIKCEIISWPEDP